jgi:hypothetical protein
MKTSPCHFCRMQFCYFFYFPRHSATFTCIQPPFQRGKSDTVFGKYFFPFESFLPVKKHTLKTHILTSICEVTLFKTI